MVNGKAKHASRTIRNTGVRRVPDVLKDIGAASKRNGTDRLSSRQIDQIIRDTRRERAARREA